MKKSFASKNNILRALSSSMALLSLLLLTCNSVYAQSYTRGLDLGFPAPGEIYFHLDRYIEELSYNPTIVESTYFNNWKRSPGLLQITDTVNLSTVGDLKSIQNNNISFFQAVRSDTDSLYHLFIQPIGDNRLIEYQCELHNNFKEVDCSSLKFHLRKEGAKSLLTTSAFNALFRQDKTRTRDLVEIYQDALDTFYAMIEYPQGSLSSSQLSFKEFNGSSFLLVVKNDKKSIDVYQFSNSLVNVGAFQNITKPNATITASELGVKQIDEIFQDTFVPNFPVIRTNNTFVVFNVSDFLYRWDPIGQFTPQVNQSNGTGDLSFSVYVSFPKIVLISPVSHQILEYDMTNFTSIVLSREYLTYGCNFTSNASQEILSQLSAGQNLLYVFCQPDTKNNNSYLFVYDVEHSFKESALDYEYQVHPTNANIRKAFRMNSASYNNFRFTVASVDSVSDLIFYIKDWKINSIRLYRHYQVTGTISKDQYCSSVYEFDCFYHTYISMQSDLDLPYSDDKKFVEELYIDVTFTQVPPKVSKALTHSTWSNHGTQLNTFELFDGSIFNLTIQKPEGLNLFIRSPLNLQKESVYRLPSTETVLDYNTNQVDRLFMTIGTKVCVFDLNLTSNASKLLRQHPVGPNCRYIFPVPKTQDFVLVCYAGDQVYNVSSYTYNSTDSILTLQWRKLVNSISFKGKMSPDGKLFYIIYDISDANYHFVEQYSLDPESNPLVHFIQFPFKDFERQKSSMHLTNNTFIQAFDIAIDSANSNYLLFAMTNDYRVIYCRTSIANKNDSICRARMAYLFEPRPDQRPETAIFNELKILSDTDFLVNTLNSFTYYFSTSGRDTDESFMIANAELGFAYFSSYPKYSHMAVDGQNNLFVIANNGSSEDPLDCVLFMYADVSFWSVEDRGYVEPPLTVLGLPCPLPNYSPKILTFNGFLLIVDEQKIYLYSSQVSYTLQLGDVAMFEPSVIELPIIASNDYQSVNVTWVIYGNLLYRPINYVVWITDATVWFLLIFIFLVSRSRGVPRQLRASLSKYFKKVSRKVTDLLWEMSLPMMTTFFIYIFGLVTQGGIRNSFFVFFLVLSFNGFLRSLVVIMVQEKQQRLKEYLKVCGMKMSTYILSFLIMGFIKAAIIGLVQLLTIWFLSDLDNILWILLGLMPTIASMVFRTLAFSSFFERHRFASEWVGFIFGILSVLVFIPRFRNGYQSTAWFLTVILPEIGFGLGVSTSGLRDTLNYDYSIMDTIKLNTFGSLMYLLAFLYLDQIIPNEYGIRKSKLFCLPRWPRNLLARLTKKVSDLGVPMIQLHEIRADFHSEEEPIDASSARFHEKIPEDSGLTRSIVVDTVRKTFADAVAVNNVSFVAYEKQILCILGHKGSGKSALLNLLAGMYNPDFGDIRYGLLDFKEFFSDIRSKIGYCSSSDVLSSYLTVEETLKLIGDTKGVPYDRLEHEMNEFYEKLGLGDEKETFVKYLTKSQKRKLSVALALLGNRKYILLDEPTADLDARSKMKIWELLREYRNEGKTIIITTKDTAEVEAIADRVAVISSGQVFTLGSVEYVKEKLEVGYKIFITPSSDQTSTEEFSKLKPKVENIIQNKIPLAFKEENSPQRVLQFGFSFKDVHKFGAMFEELEQTPQIKILLELTQFKDAFGNLPFTEEKYINTASYFSWLEESFGLESEEQTQPVPPEIIQTPRANFFSQLYAMVFRKLLYSIRCPPAITMYVLAVLYLVSSSVFAFRRTQGKLEDNPWTELYIVGFWNIVFWTLLLPSFAALPVTEREDRYKIRDTLRIQGLGSFAYWIGTFIPDLIIAALFLLLELTIVYITASAFPFIYQYMLELSAATYAYALCCVTWAYLIGFIFGRGSDTYRFLGLIYFFIVFAFGFVFFNALWNDARGNGWFFWVLKCAYFLAFPVGPYAESLIFLHVNKVSGFSKDELENDFYGSILYTNFWIYILQLLINSLVYLLVAVICEQVTFSYLEKPEEPESADNVTIIQLDPIEIEKEKMRVNDANNQDPILVQGLGKVLFEGPVLLKNIDFGVQRGSIMGILGPNHSGKSLLIKIIAGMEKRSYGTVRLHERAIERLPKLDRAEIGIHTDHNPIWEHFSVKQHLKIHCMLKGISGPDLQKNQIDTFIQRLHLTEFKDKKLKFLSPQAKKKTSLAIALLATPSVLILDDAISNLDLSSRQFVKELLKLVVEKRNATVLTSMRSMAEAESFCDKLAVLVNGRICSLGYASQMKERFAKALKLTMVKYQTTDPSFEQKVQSIFPRATPVPSTDPLEEVFELPVEKFILQKAFSEFTILHNQGNLKDFYFCNATLSQMFLYISQFQE